MATLYVAEFTGISDTAGGGAQIAETTPIVEQTIAIGGASAPSATFAQTTRIIRVHADSICSISIGNAPVATTAKMRMAANQTEYFGVSSGDKIAVIANV
jgi:hypothetical protein